MPVTGIGGSGRAWRASVDKDLGLSLADQLGEAASRSSSSGGNLVNCQAMFPKPSPYGRRLKSPLCSLASPGLAWPYVWASLDPFRALDGLLLIVLLVVRDCGWSVLVPADGEVVDLADWDAGGDVRRGEGYQARSAGEQRGQRDFAVEPGQGGAQAEVGSGGEAEVRVGLAADVELVRAGEGDRKSVV